MVCAARGWEQPGVCGQADCAEVSNWKLKTSDPRQPGPTLRLEPGHDYVIEVSRTGPKLHKAKVEPP